MIKTAAKNLKVGMMVVNLGHIRSVEVMDEGVLVIFANRNVLFYDAEAVVGVIDTW
jgi:hypothetical protein